MIRPITCLLTLAVLPLFADRSLADPPEPVVVDAVTDRYRPISLDQEKLGGLLASRLRANSEGYLEHVDDHNAPPDSKGLGGPREEGSIQQPGRALEAMAKAYEYRHDEHLRAVMQSVEKLVVASLTPEKAAGDRHELLVRKYDLLGLLAYYHVTTDESALDAATRAGKALLRSFPKGSAYEHPAILIEPFVLLYRYTEDGQYLDFCRSAADAWIQSEGKQADATFESLSALHDLVDLYRITGDESYFRSITASWLDVRNRRLSLTGAPVLSKASTAGDDKEESGTCATVSWIQLTLDLLRVTGEAQYGEQLERTIYNQLLAGQDGMTGVVLESAPLNGSKQPASTSDACGSNEALGVSLIPAAVWGRYGNGIAIVLYSAGRATFQLSHRRGTVQVYSEAVFPERGDFLLHVEPAHNLRFPVRLRVPEWTNSFVADIGGSHLIGKPGDFLTINREWRRGDTVKISMDMTVRTIDGSPTYPDEIALQRGPQVLALSQVFNPQLKDLADAAVTAGAMSRVQLLPAGAKLPANWPGEQAYTIAGEYRGKPQELILAPFADAKTYRVWLRKPSASSGAMN